MAPARLQRLAALTLCGLGLLALGSAPSHADSADADSAWGDGFGWPGVVGIVYAMTVYHGDLIVGGRITQAGGVPVSAIARWDGVAWHPLGSGLGSITFDEPFVATLAVHDDRLIAGGAFARAGNVFAANVASWNGADWAALGDGLDISVQALAVNGGTLFAGGEFAHSGSTPLARVARWDGSAWQPLGSGVDDTPVALVSYGGALIAAGNFTHAGGAEANHVARWDGASWSPLGSGTSGGIGGHVTSLTVFGGELIAGGYFASAGGVAASGVAAWNGTSWRPLGAGTDPFVFALAVYHGHLIVGGNLGSAGGLPVESIAQWDGASWSGLATRTGRANGSTVRMVVSECTVFDDALIVAGDFDVAQEMPAVNIARWDGSGWTPLGWGLSDNYYFSWVSSFAEYDDRLLIGGRLAHRQNSLLPSVDLRAFDGTTMDLFEWRVSALSTPEVTALTVYGGQLIAAGTFTSMGGIPSSMIAGWDGTAWHPLGGDTDAPIEALAVYHGELVAGGSFTQIGGVNASRIAGWDGVSWHPLGAGVDGPVGVLVPYGDDLVAGGLFGLAGGESAASIARWDGANWSPIGSGIGGLVRSATVYHGDLVAGGQFTTAGGTIANNIALWNGSAWGSLGAGTDDEVTALAVFHDELVAGGYFAWAGSVAASSVASWNGVAWAPLGSGLADPDFRLAVARALHPRGDTLYIGGRFDSAGGKPAYNLVTWTGEATPPPPPPPASPATLQLEASRPNPFRSTTSFRFELPAAGRVRFTLHDLGGRRIATLWDGTLGAGPQSAVWDGRDDDGRRVETGIYFARLEAAGAVRVRRVALIR